jgi:hypothetical protein
MEGSSGVDARKEIFQRLATREDIAMIVPAAFRSLRGAHEHRGRRITTIGHSRDVAGRQRHAN